MNRSNRKAAIAEPKPNSFSPLNDRRHISNASVVASFWTEPGAIA